MGTYVYKVTARTVKLENGEVANVAVFAYKPYLFAEYDQHARSGAARHDKAAHEGKRGKWVVIGTDEGNGVYSVSADSMAIQLPVAMGSFNDGWFYSESERGGWATSKPAQVYQGKRMQIRRSVTEIVSSTAERTTGKIHNQILSKNGWVTTGNTQTFYA